MSDEKLGKKKTTLIKAKKVTTASEASAPVEEAAAPALKKKVLVKKRIVVKKMVVAAPEAPAVPEHMTTVKPTGAPIVGAPAAAPPSVAPPRVEPDKPREAPAVVGKPVEAPGAAAATPVAPAPARPVQPPAPAARPAAHAPASPAARPPERPVGPQGPPRPPARTGLPPSVREGTMPRPSVREGQRPGAPRPPMRGGFGSRPPGPGPRPPGSFVPGQRPFGPRPGGPRPFGPRPMGPRPPGGGRPGGPGGSPPPGAEAPGAHRKFKTKRKGADYQKRREQEEHQEKLLQMKKRAAQRANPIPKEIAILESITVSEMARKMNLKSSELISKLMGMGMMVTINQQIDAETATLLAEEYGAKVNVVSLYEETVIQEQADQDGDLKTRPPIVTIMGHVDHGKTKLLDAIRETNVVATEHGGITQHIGAYAVDLSQGRIVFLDTPGHEAFTAMRMRGAQVTDIVVLVVAADDGVMPQTLEAISHAKAAGVPIIVAVNKVDLPDANVERVKQQLSEQELMPEDWGGKTLYVEVSALKKTGIERLLEAILLQAELLELKANYSVRASGRVIESRVDLGRGIVATVLIERGVLRVGDPFVAGVFAGRVRALFDDKGKRLDEAPPATPVEILGLDGLPNAGDPFHVTEDEQSARQIGTKRQELKRMEGAQHVSKVTLDNLYEQLKQGAVKELKVIVKADVHGSVEALQSSLEKLTTPEVKLSVVQASAGPINYSDVLLAATSDAIILGFHVRPTATAQALADREKVEIRKYNIIYDAVDDIRSAMEGLLAPDLKEEVIGTVEVRQVFKVPKIGTIAGCYVTSGKVRRNAQARLIREKVQIFEGKISSLRRFKDDAREVESGFECGIGIEGYQDIQVGDEIEAFEVREVAKKLSEGGRRGGGTKEA